jgi:hypothetical protein
MSVNVPVAVDADCHWYPLTVEPVNVPGTAVNVLPNLTVPVIVGVGAPVINGNETGAVAAEVFDASVNPAFFAVSVTVIVEPKSALLIRYVAVVATGVPPTDH